jgi:alpha-glucosidase
MNAWQPLDFTLTLDFLEDGIYEIETAADGINAEKNPQDYKLQKLQVTALDQIPVHLAPGGGFVARIYKKTN